MLALLLCTVCFAYTLQSSAATENVVAAAKKAAAGKWITNKKGIRYRYKKDNKYAKDTWLKIDGGIYRFDAQGYCETGWIKWKNNRYYASPEGRLYVRKWLRRGEKYYYFLSSGILARNRQIKSGGKYYYVDKNGIRLSDSWKKQDGKYYYYGKDGARLQKTWVRYRKKYYYVDASGARVANTWVGNYYVGEDGARKTNCVVGGYYLDATGKKTVRRFNGKYIFVGDSRTVGMKLSVSSADTLYIAKESTGYSWLESTGGPELEIYLTMNPDVKVVLALGVNDLGNVGQYIAYYRGLTAKYPKTKFIVLSVNPVNESIASAHGYTVRNSQIETFNKKMKAAFGSRVYLNTYSYLKKKGFGTRDGLHYTTAEYRNLYNYIIKKIK